MSEFINKHTIKIQLGVLAMVLILLATWSLKAGAYFEKIDNNTDRMNKFEFKFDQLATKDDLKILKQDLKDYINKK